MPSRRRSHGTEKRNSRNEGENKYNAENYDRLYPYVKRGKKEKYQRAAEAAGCSLNEFMEKAMDKLADEILGE